MILVHGLRAQTITAGEVRWQGCEAGGHIISTARKQSEGGERERNGGIQLASSIPSLFSMGPQSVEWHHLVQVELPSLGGPIGKILTELPRSVCVF